MAYRCDGCDSAAKLTKYQRNILGTAANISVLLRVKRTINTGVRVTGTGGTGGAARPTTGQILPRGK